MPKIKRLIIASLSGLFFGFVCLAIASCAPGKLLWPTILQIILSRTLIGFAIGISRVSFGHWSLHGLIMGVLLSLPLAFSGLMAPPRSDFSNTDMFVWTLILGMGYGFLTELITSVLFKARMEK